MDLAANAKLIVCLDGNSRVLEECRDEPRFSTTIPPLQTASQQGSDLLLSWPSANTVSYQLQSTTNFSITNWTNEGAPSPGTGGLLATNLSIGPDPANFFRLQLLGN